MFDYKPKELKLFWYFMNERHRIYLKKKAGEKWPWTKDKVLREYKFTNVYRQLDRVTECWTDRWLRLLHSGKNMTNGEILFYLCMFRFFNWPETYDTLYYGMSRWNRKTAIELLRKRKEEDFEKIFTGAYIITGMGKDQPKYETITDALDYAYQNRNKLVKRIMKKRSMEAATEILQEIPTQGPFTSYEIVCDLRHTRILANATDINSWANAGPGAKRGIHRLLTGSKDWDGQRPDYNAVMRDLLVKALKFGLEPHVKKCEWPFEMREIEHSLCEFDKMRRVMNGEGTPRSRYIYKDPELWTNDSDE